MQKTSLMLFAAARKQGLRTIHQGLWCTKREKVIDTEPIHVSADQKRRFDRPPVVGGAFIVGGVLFVIAGRKRAG